LNNLLRRGAGYLAIGNLTFILSGYATNVWLARHLGPATYGRYSVLLVLMTVVGVVQNSGPPQALTRAVSKDRESALEWLLNGIVFQICATVSLSIIIFVFAPSLAKFMNEPNLTDEIRLLGLVFPIYGLYLLYTGYFSGIHAFGRQAIMNVVYALAKMVLIITLAYVWGIKGAILGFVLAPLAGMCAGIVRPAGKLNQTFIRTLALSAAPLTLFAIIVTLQLSVDLIAVKKLVPFAAAAGYYAACQNIALIPYYGLSSISNVVFPGITTQFSTGSEDQTRKLIENSIRYQCILLIPVCLLIAALSRQILIFLFGGGYAPAATALSILIIGYIFLSLYMLAGGILNGLNRTYYCISLSFAGVVISVLSCLWLVPHYYLEGAALSISISAFAITIVGYVVIHAFTKFTFPWLSIFRQFSASAIISWTVFLLQPSTTLMPPTFILAMFLYFLLLLIFGELKLSNLTRVPILRVVWRRLE
jgi:stage V sporulation protein B